MLLRHGSDGAWKPVLPPGPDGDVSLNVIIETAGQQAQRAADGLATPLVLQVRNTGDASAYWIRLSQETGPDDPLLLIPPPVVGRLDPGQSVGMKAQVSYHASWTDPRGYEGVLNLSIDRARGDPIRLAVPVRATAPELTLAAKPELVAGDAPALAVRLRNAGGQDLDQAKVQAHLGGLDGDLPIQTQPRVKAGAELRLSFALPEDARLDESSRLTLTAREQAYPPHDWTFADLPVRLPMPPWQDYAAWSVLVAVLGTMLWYLRQYTHPLTQELALRGDASG